MQNPLRDFGPVAVAAPLPRRSRQAKVTWGSRIVTVGGDAVDSAGRVQHRAL